MADSPPKLSPAVQRILSGQEGFSLFLGGPLYQALRRIRLTDDALRLLRRRILFISLLTWLPLLLLSLLEGQATGGVIIPFLMDVEAHVRFLLAVPLLIAAEFFVQDRVRLVPRLFLERRLVPEAEVPRFEAALESAYRLRNSVLAEVVLLVIVYGLGVMVLWKGYIAFQEPSWYATGDGGLTWAGLWFGFVSLPVFQFLVCRWYFRLFIWARFLWQVARLPLALMPLHPDRVGGLGFLSLVVQGFMILAAAHGAMLAALIADRILHAGEALPGFILPIAALVLFVLLLGLLPLCVFSGGLAAAKRRGQREYGTLAGVYVRAFEAKWLHGDPPADEPLIGTADIQSLADLANSFEVVGGMRVVPITKVDVVGLAAATLLPLAPLLLTIMPLEQLIRGLFGLVF